MADNKRIVKNTIFLYIRMFLIMAVTLYTSRVILQILGIEDFGIYNVVGGVVMMFSFLNGSLAGATSRYLTFELGKKNYTRLQHVFNTALLIHFALALLIVLLSETIGLWFFYEKMIIPPMRLDAAFWVYQISVLTSVLSLIQVPYNATIIAHENMGVYAYVGVFEVLMKLFIVFLISFSPIDKLISYAILLLLLQVILTLFYRSYCFNHYSESHWKLSRDKGLYKEMFGYASADLIGNISVLAQGQGLNILLNMFFGPVVNAARAIAYQVQGAVTQFSGNFMTAVRPQIIKSYAEKDISGMMKLVENSSCFSYYLMWLIIFPLWLESDYILHLWLGEYPEHTVNFLHLILILCLIQTIKTPRTTIFHATGHLKLVNLVVGSILCAAFPLAYLFLKLGYAPEYVFIASNISIVLSEVASIIVLKRYISFSAIHYIKMVYGRCILVTLVSIILPILVYNNLGEPSFIKLILTCILTSLSVIITSLTIGVDKTLRTKIIMLVRDKLRVR